MLRELRQPRYAALSALMILVAGVCVGAGTWQIARLHTKAAANSQLRHNAHLPTAPLSSVVPIVGHAKTPSAHRIEFRTVTATGTYQPEHTALVRHRSIDGNDGFLIVTPLRTAEGTLLVVRGFLAATSAGTVPTPPPPPTGVVTVTTHLRAGETNNDQAEHLTNGQVESINPGEQASRLAEPVFAAYGELGAGQPGSAKLTAMPKPDLSNPAGGAIEPQHLAYIIQWYLFALLALAAPVAMVRAETRELRVHTELDELADVSTPQPSAASSQPSPEQLRAAKLADRYGRAVH